MKYLLDTPVLLLALFDPEKLTPEAKAILLDRGNEIFLSAASLWEAEIRRCRKPEEMPYSVELVEKAISVSGYKILPIKPSHIRSVGVFAKQEIHQDAFDHLLLSIAFSEQMTLLSRNENICQYKNAMVVRA